MVRSPGGRDGWSRSSEDLSENVKTTVHTVYLWSMLSPFPTIVIAP
jgi:hypothetical protein